MKQAKTNSIGWIMKIFCGSAAWCNGPVRTRAGQNL
jgi:hypothetical protein